LSKAELIYKSALATEDKIQQSVKNVIMELRNSLKDSEKSSYTLKLLTAVITTDLRQLLLQTSDNSYRQLIIQSILDVAKKAQFLEIQQLNFETQLLQQRKQIILNREKISLELLQLIQKTEGNF